MAGSFFGKVASDTLGLSDIGKIIAPHDFDKVDGDDYIMHEDGEKIYFVIKSKQDEYVFTNHGLLHVDGQSAMSKKRTVVRYDFYNHMVHSITLETAGTIDADVEIKFVIGERSFSIDVDKNQLEQLKDLYKALIEVGRLQAVNRRSVEDGLEGLKMAHDVFSRIQMEGNIAKELEAITNFNYDFVRSLRTLHNNKDFTTTFEKYINN